jgi:hypothetical protein
MADDKQERVDEIRSVRSKRRAQAMVAPGTQEGQSEVRDRLKAPGGVVETSGTGSVVGAGAGTATRSPWLMDRLTLSLEAQIAMIELRATQKLTLADMGYNNRLKVVPIRPGVFLRAEPTGCYRMMYHNRMDRL